MGYWENTTYVRHGAAADVATCLSSLFAKERMERVEPPPRHEHAGIGEPMQYAGALENDLWGVAVFPGAPPWTIVKTAPLVLHGDRPVDGDRMRLAEVCAALSSSAIQVNVYDSLGIVLVEVSARGEVLLSGFNDRGDPSAWHSEQIAEADLFPRFRVHPFGDIAPGDALRSTAIAEALAARLGGENAASCDNGTSVETLVTHAPLGARAGSVLYFRWQGPSRLVRR